MRKSCLMLTMVLWATAGCRPAKEKPLLDRLTNVSHSWVRSAAMEDLDKLPDVQKKKLIQPLLSRLENHNEYVRQNAAYALAHLGPLAQEAVPALRKATSDRDRGVRCAARVALARMGQEVDETVNAFVRDMQSRDVETRREAITGLAAIGEPAKASAPALGQALQDEDKYVRQFAANALTCLGPGASAAVPDLIKGLRSPDRNIRHLCSVALRNVNSPEAQEVLKSFHLD